MVYKNEPTYRRRDGSMGLRTVEVKGDLTGRAFITYGEGSYGGRRDEDVVRGHRASALRRAADAFRAAGFTFTTTAEGITVEEREHR